MKEMQSNKVVSSIDIPCIGIKKGDLIDSIFLKVAEEIKEVKGPSFDFSCVFEDCEDCDCSSTEGYESAINCIIKYLCEISDKNICISAESLNGVSRGVSKAATQLVGRSVPYTISINKEKGAASLSYNLMDFASDLPGDCALSYVNVSAAGMDGKRGVNIRDTNSKSTSITIPYDRFPATVDFDLRVNTEEGNVKMWGTVVVPCPQNESGFLPLEITDFSSSQKRNKTRLNDVLGDITGKIKMLFSFYEGLKTYKNFGGEYVRKATGIIASIGANTAGIEAACKKIEELEAQIESIKVSKTGDCD